MALEDYTKARAVYETACEALSADGWKLDKNDEALQIGTRAIGDDLPIEITITADGKRQLLVVFSRLPVVVPDDKLVDLAVVICYVNNRMVDGCFDFDLKSGKIYFRLTSSFIDAEIGKEAILYMVLCSCKTIDEYNDKFLMLTKGLLTTEQFLASEQD